MTSSPGYFLGGLGLRLKSRPPTDSVFTPFVIGGSAAAGALVVLCNGKVKVVLLAVRVVAFGDKMDDLDVTDAELELEPLGPVRNGRFDAAVLEPAVVIGFFAGAGTEGRNGVPLWLGNGDEVDGDEEGELERARLLPVRSGRLPAIALGPAVVIGFFAAACTERINRVPRGLGDSDEVDGEEIDGDEVDGDDVEGDEDEVDGDVGEELDGDEVDSDVSEELDGDELDGDDVDGDEEEEDERFAPDLPDLAGGGVINTGTETWLDTVSDVLSDLSAVIVFRPSPNATSIFSPTRRASAVFGDCLACLPPGVRT